MNLHDAKTRLSDLLEKALSVGGMIAAKAGRPVAKLAASAPVTRRELGSAAGQVSWQEGWHLPLNEAEMNEFLR